MKTKKRNDFLLPDDLGWACNDEISKLIDVWFLQTLEAGVHEWTLGKNAKQITMWSISKAQLMDDIYAIIKRYQNEAN